MSDGRKPKPSIGMAYQKFDAANGYTKPCAACVLANCIQCVKPCDGGVPGQCFGCVATACPKCRGPCGIPASAAFGGSCRCVPGITGCLATLDLCTAGSSPACFPSSTRKCGGCLCINTKG
eukprot:GFUD01007784.1.p1 GENE.GFUD01007784.1~~GFUD01007784.1.p1  ORF type:complete len:142 (+),score=3.36 GFUD01007784.1:64-426(+)